ncbi:hypothetical protein EV649_7208 [Kribbella sp. VKM Ac-2569]|uniref:hypothetical protein n=1 Tax=Kribbella sp. VKM Ac-2569 TaxID=2512220 RepID=UPI00102BAFCE|nr:hypothetical protein [Kribbella sp. VKM Ac-2569]RZT12840.1 hypothetical protein EV649_7208 [Kribbella sp. VKM Ac-2569]
MKFRAAVATAAAIPLALGLAACGGEPKATGYKPSTPVSTPATATSSQAPQKVAPAAHLDAASFMPAMKKGMIGKDTARLTMRMVAGGQTMTMSGVLSMNPLAAQLDMVGAEFGGRMKMILIDDVVYLSTPDLPAGKYLKIDANSDNPMAKELGGMLEEMSPTKIYDAFDAGLRNAQYIKTETLSGHKVDRYAVTVDVAAAMKAEGQKMPAGMPKNIVYTIWMGSADHLMYKVVFDMQGVSATMTADDWGKPVSIKAPSAKNIVRR